MPIERTTEIKIGSGNSTRVELRGSLHYVRITMIEPATGYGMGESSGERVGMTLNSTRYQELVDALAEVGRAAGWCK